MEKYQISRSEIAPLLMAQRISHCTNKIKIGSNVVVNSGVQFLTASHHLNDSSWRQYSKAIHVDDFAWVATNAVILPGVTIGRGAVVWRGGCRKRGCASLHGCDLVIQLSLFQKDRVTLITPCCFVFSL